MNMPVSRKANMSSSATTPAVRTDTEQVDPYHPCKKSIIQRSHLPSPHETPMHVIHPPLVQFHARSAPHSKSAGTMQITL
ncbi:hypothetical protein BDV33DRAFT_177360 [Aspergillus novoparasiticus]|uniref:Uncharacterized protein n=1 Tax=Aspergillus novoparasiticus TaxID=986946 RepID=A0A5N6EIB0_9EURO|nr:hypothetical protein BDV33DRAFT_177360 [Aspergillus novoparasiticus]